MVKPLSLEVEEEEEEGEAEAEAEEDLFFFLVALVGRLYLTILNLPALLLPIVFFFFFGEV